MLCLQITGGTQTETHQKRFSLRINSRLTILNFTTRYKFLNISNQRLVLNGVFTKKKSNKFCITSLGLNFKIQKT
jgi:hypothetical protein